MLVPNSSLEQVVVEGNVRALLCLVLAAAIVYLFIDVFPINAKGGNRFLLLT
jgi:hypothetical protein